MKIPFNRPYLTGKELDYIRDATQSGWLSSKGAYTRRCEEWLEARIGCARALLTYSGTGALEMAAIVAGIEPGDEVIVPSFTFVSTAQAFVLRGAIPVFVDIEAGTLNLNPDEVEKAITPRTKAIVPVHYAGVSCDMDLLMKIAARHNLTIIEDAAHALMATCGGAPLGSRGHLAVLSFHEAKNISSGEGGALLVNDKRLVGISEQVADKGTDRARFFRGEVDKYTWRTLGSAFYPSEVNAAFLWAQLEAAEEITARRVAIWQKYYAAFEHWAARGVRLPSVPENCCHNGHIFYLVLPTRETRAYVLDRLKSQDIGAVFHYVPLHNSPAGLEFGRVSGSLSVTEHIAECMMRLPFWLGLEPHQDVVIRAVNQALQEIL